MTHRQHRKVTLILAGLVLVLTGVLGGVLVSRQLEPGVAPARTIVEEIHMRPRPAVGSDSPRPVVLADPEQLSSFFKTAAAEVRESVVFVQVFNEPGEGGWFDNLDGRLFGERGYEQSVGSGVIITASGYVVTNNHVVEDADRIQVTLGDKRQFRADVMGVDPSTDLAVLRLRKATDLPVAALGDSDALEVGEWVLAVGNPFRLTSTVTAGIVSALGRQVNIISDANGIEDFIQTDAAINPGNSGGALVNLDGDLIGINTAIATESGANEGYGFAVPVNLVKRVVADLIEYGEVRRGYLGVSVADVDAELAGELGLEAISGVHIQTVLSGGAADRGGVRRGDVILSVNDSAVDATNGLQSMIARGRPGDDVALDVWRDGAPLRLSIQLLGNEDASTRKWLADARRPPRLPGPPDDDVPEGGDVRDYEEWGFGAREANERDLQRFDADFGVYVAYVGRDGLAAEAELPRQILIQYLDTRRVDSLNALAAALAEARKAGSETVLVRALRPEAVPVYYELRVPSE